MNENKSIKWINETIQAIINAKSFWSSIQSNMRTLKNVNYKNSKQKNSTQNCVYLILTMGKKWDFYSEKETQKKVSNNR